jgi:hypothetical protein
MFFFLGLDYDHKMDQKDLIACVRKYRKYDDDLKKLNAATNDLREKRKLVELEMGDILRRNAFSHIHKLDLPDDKSEIKIARPEQWSKGWTLSAKELATLVTAYFATPGPKTAKDCIEYVVTQRKNDLVSKEFSFTRIIRTDVDDDDESVVGRTHA